jgi:hypothetical protein
VSEPLVEALEKAREYGVFEKLYGRMGTLYTTLQGGDEPTITFDLVTDNTPETRWQKVIAASSTPVPGGIRTPVSFNRQDLLRLSVTTFWNEKVTHEESEWNESYIERTVWTVASPLLSPVGLSEIASEMVTPVTSLECSTERLEQFAAEFQQLIEGLKAIILAEDMQAMWALKVDTAPLLKKYETLLENNPAHPEFAFCRSIATSWKADRACVTRKANLERTEGKRRTDQICTRPAKDKRRIPRKAGGNRKSVQGIEWV